MPRHIVSGVTAMLGHIVSGVTAMLRYIVSGVRYIASITTIRLVVVYVEVRFSADFDIWREVPAKDVTLVLHMLLSRNTNCLSVHRSQRISSNYHRDCN